MASEFRGLVFAWLLIALAGAVVIAGLRFLTGISLTLPPQRRRAVAWTGPIVTIAFLVFYLTGPIILAYTDAGAVATHVYGHPVDKESAGTVGHIGRRLAGRAAPDRRLVLARPVGRRQPAGVRRRAPAIAGRF